MSDVFQHGLWLSARAIIGKFFRENGISLDHNQQHKQHSVVFLGSVDRRVIIISGIAVQT